MAKAIIDDIHLTEIADAIRAMSGSTDVYYPSEMANAIYEIDGGGGSDTSSFLYTAGSYFGDRDGTTTTTLTVTVDSNVGTKVLLIIMHRDTITLSDEDYYLVDSTMAENYVQYISIYEKVIREASDAGDVVITQASSARMSACTFFVPEGMTVYENPTQQEMDSSSANYKYTLEPSDSVRLIVFNTPFSGSTRETLLPRQKSLPEDMNTSTNMGTVRFAAFFSEELCSDIVYTAGVSQSESSFNYNRLFIYETNYFIRNPILIEKTITGNGTYDPLEEEVDGYSRVEVHVPATDIASIQTHSSSSSGFIIRNGWISGFSSQSNYFDPLDVNGNILDVDWSQDFEIFVRFKVSEIVNAKQALFGSRSGYYRAPSIEVSANNSGLWCGFSTNGTSWTNQTSFGSFPADTELYVKATWDSTLGEYIITFFNGTEIETRTMTPSAPHYYSSSNSRLEFGGINVSSSHYARNVLFDLGNIYIKQNDIIVFGPGAA